MEKVTRSTLISVKRLKEIILNKPPHIRLLDASWHLPNTGRDAHQEFLGKHIPGALFFDIDGCSLKETKFPHMIPPPELFEEYVGNLGINNETEVIVYDNNPQFPLFSAQRVWWTFRLFGHHNVALLEGGLPKWLSEGGEVTAELVKTPKQRFNATFNPSLVKSFEDIEKNVACASFALVDARPAGRFAGTAPEPRQDTKPGCIPQSKNIPFMDLMNLEERTFKSPEELRKIFEDANVDLNQPLVATCGSGISACLVALGAYLCGKEDVAVYDGSWTEWYMRAPAQLKQNVPE